MSEIITVDGKGSVANPEFKFAGNFNKGTTPTLIDSAEAKRVQAFIENIVFRSTYKINSGGPPANKFVMDLSTDGAVQWLLDLQTALEFDTEPTLGADLELDSFSIRAKKTNSWYHQFSDEGFVIMPQNAPAATDSSLTSALKFGGWASGSAVYVGFKAPAPGGITSTIIWTLPAEDGNADEVLTTDGSGVLTWAATSGTGTVTSVDVSGGSTGLTFSGGPVTSSGTITMDGILEVDNGGTNFDSYTVGDILYASDTAEFTKLNIGSTDDVLTVAGGVPTWAAGGGGGGMSSWDLDGDSGSTQSIIDAATVTIAGDGTAISTEASATDTLTITLDDTGVLAGSYTNTDLTVDDQGRITSASDGSTSGGITNFDLAGDSGSTQTIGDLATVTIAGGTGLSSVASATDTVTVNMDDTAVTPGSYTNCDLTVDAQGRLTAASNGSGSGAPTDASYVVIDLDGTLTDERKLTAGTNVSITDAGANGNVTIASTDEFTGTVTSITPAADAGSGTAITSSGTITVSGDTGITTSVSGTTIEVDLDDTAVTAGSYTNTDLTVDAQGRITAASNGSGSGAPVDAEYVVLTANGTLTNERVLTAGTNITVTDAGAGGAVTIASTDQYEGTVTSVATSNGTFVDVSGGTITSTGTITADLSATGLGSPSSDYFLRGDNTWAEAPGTGTVTEIVASTGLDGGTITTSGTISLANTTVSAGSYTSADITVDAQGRLTAASSGTGTNAAPDDATYVTLSANGTLTEERVLTAGTNITVTDSGAGGGTVTIASTDEYTGTVTEIVASTGLDGGTITSSGTISLANTAVTAGSYTNTDLTVDDQGRITAASSGTSGGAPSDATYVCLSTNGDLTDERVLTAGTNITVTDAGAGSTVTIASTDEYTGTVTSITGGADSGSGTAITSSGTLTVAGGTNVTTSISGTTITVDSTDQYEGTVTSVAVAGGTGLTSTGGPVTASGTITVNLDDTAVTAGSYTNADITVDAQGRLTSAADGSGSGAPSDAKYVTLGLDGDLSAERVLTAGDNITITDGGANSTVTIASTDEYEGTVTSIGITAGAYLTASGTNPVTSSGTITLNHNASGVTAGTYGSSTLIPALTVDEYGHVTAGTTYAAPTGTVTSVATGTGLTGGTITTSGTISLANTAVTAGAYTNADITVDAQGRLTSAASGSATGGAPADATFVTLSTNGTLTNERVLTAGSNITLTDGGAGGAVTIAATGGTGTVTSVQVSGGSTGLTFADGPITTSGTITMAGTLATGYGGTGTGTYVKGDIFSAPSTDVLGRLGIGAADQVLTVHPTNGVAAWADAPGLNSAPDDATYVTLSLDGDLDNERVLTAGTALTSVDSGANGTITINHDDIGTPNTYGSASLIPVITTDTQGHVSGVTTAANPQGTVTSVAISGGNTGLAFSGSPITAAGTLTVADSSLLFADYGGTGLGYTGGAQDYTKGDVIYCSDVTDDVASLAVLNIGSEDDVLTVSVDGIPSWAAGGGGGGGVTSIIAGTNVTISSTGGSGTGDVTINSGLDVGTDLFPIEADNGGFTQQSDSTLTFESSDDSIIITTSGGNLDFSADKLAIVKSIDPDPDAFVAVYCTESAEVRFDDVQTIYPDGKNITEVEMCPEYHHSCEPDSIQVVGHSCSDPALVGFRIEGNVIFAEVNTITKVPESIVMHLSGIRKGRKDVRHEPRTKAQAEFNNAFWNIPKMKMPKGDK